MLQYDICQCGIIKMITNRDLSDCYSKDSDNFQLAQVNKIKPKNRGMHNYSVDE